MPSIGSHCVLELYDSPPALLDDPETIAAAIRVAAEAAGATLLHTSQHRFEPQGVTAMGLLAESHISVHTWPELGYAACDVFTCGEQTLPERACEALARALKAGRHEMRRFPRGQEVAARPRRLPAGRDEVA